MIYKLCVSTLDMRLVLCCLQGFGSLQGILEHPQHDDAGFGRILRGFCGPCQGHVM